MVAIVTLPPAMKREMVWNVPFIFIYHVLEMRHSLIIAGSYRNGRNQDDHLEDVFFLNHSTLSFDTLTTKYRDVRNSEKKNINLHEILRIIRGEMKL